MKQYTHRLLLWFIGLALVACSPTAPAPTQTSPPLAIPATMLPTAVPPEAFAGSWAISFEYQFPPNSWAVGVHRYQFYIQCPVVNQEDFSSEWVLFDVSEDAILYNQLIYLRLSGLSTGILAPSDLLIVHPDQPTVAIITFLGLTEDVAKQASECEGLIRWDDKPPWLLTPGEPFRP